MTKQPINKESIHVIEGFVDPGGSVPDWIYKIIVPNAPYKAIRKGTLNLSTSL